VITAANRVPQPLRHQRQQAWQRHLDGQVKVGLKPDIFERRVQLADRCPPVCCQERRGCQFWAFAVDRDDAELALGMTAHPTPTICSIGSRPTSAATEPITAVSGLL
jgi:hypothetical protein